MDERVKSADILTGRVFFHHSPGFLGARLTLHLGDALQIKEAYLENYVDAIGDAVKQHLVTWLRRERGIDGPQGDDE